MLLTDKAKEDFGDQCFYQFKDFNKLTEYCQNALIIEWLDSVGIIISVTYCQLSKGFDYLLHSEHYSVSSGTHERQEATKKAIEKANSLYNYRYGKN